MQDRPIMKTISAIVSFLVVAASVLSSQAAKTLIYKTKGQSALVDVFSCSSDCACSLLSIDAGESSTREGSTTFISNNINVFIATFNLCTGEEFFFGRGSTTFGGFPANWVKKGGSPVTLNLGAVNVCSFDNGGGPSECQSVSGSVTITPTSEYSFTENCRGKLSQNYPFFKRTVIYNYSNRDATATATLNVSINGVPTSFKDSEVDATIFDSKGHAVDKTFTWSF
jgi:hypothetical protein